MALKGTINNISAPHIHAGSDITSGEIDSAYLEHQPQSMARQAIINGNFDVWQRGTSLASLTDSTVTFLADRWFLIGVKDGGTPPTIAQSRQAFTPGEMPGSFYFHRITVNGAGSGYGNRMYYAQYQRIEHGTRYLGGDDKSITLRFKARSSIAGKKIGVQYYVNCGTGGSPSAGVDIVGRTWTLTSDWQDCEFTCSAPSLSGKTFGTNDNDYLALAFWYAWGSTNQGLVGATTAETWVGSGTIDIARVQVCAGDIALPFEPKTYEEELAACLRYFYRHCSNESTSNSSINLLVKYATKYLIGGYWLPVKMRVIPTISHSSPSWVTVSPATSANEVGCVDYTSNAWLTITGALSISYDSARSITNGRLVFSAGTSFSGSDGDVCGLFIGAGAYLDFSSEL